MKIYAVGNILVDKDSLPLKILPELRKAFPKISFIEIDPSENFSPPQNEPLYIIDAVEGIKEVTIFNDFKSFAKHRLISPHDYDLFFHLKFLEKLSKLPKKLFIIGIPSKHNNKSLLTKITKNMKR